MKREPKPLSPRPAWRVGVALAVIVAAALAATPARAQRNVELTPFGGWMWGGTLDYASGTIHFNGAPSYGGMLGVEIRPSEFVEIAYWYQGTDVTARPIGTAPEFKLMDLGTHYIQIGGTKVVPGGGRVQPFATGGLGMAIFSPGNAPAGISGETVFSFSLGGGLRLDMSDQVALRAQARLLLPMQLSSSSVWFGSGGGGLSVEGQAIAQGDATLGIVLKLGR